MVARAGGVRVALVILLCVLWDAWGEEGDGGTGRISILQPPHLSMVYSEPMTIQVGGCGCNLALVSCCLSVLGCDCSICSVRELIR